MTGRARIRSAAGFAAVVLAALVPPAAGHADDGPSARDLVDEARDNFVGARSVHLELTDHRRSTDRTARESVTLTMDRAGNCVGELVLKAGGGSVEIVKRGDQMWMKPDRAYWKAQLPGAQGEAAARLLEDRYVHGTTDDSALEGLARVCDLAALQKEVAAKSSSGTPVTKGKETETGDTRVIPVSTTKDGRQKVLYITSAEPHRLVRETERGRGTDRSVDLTGYDEPVPSATPSAKESVDVSRLEQMLESR
ncbi:hypothetical protein [Streptomyces sp. SP2-10]|uniref:hypothetical protein n=1 Tax=Streptomyces sp. SP2-10 TaxID=2873385 RepID=UPI001CA715E0|nr:hypothetical protein [Streptomyces sp. SP2-10]MBY8841606.1 hypothetical protein [Streptomyces sp. SP2-10]